MRPVTLRGWLWVALVASLLATGCKVLPRDPYRRAELALDRSDLTAALHGFDQVPLSDPRYADARRLAAILESRLRRHQELMLAGLRLRHDWRDDEAIAAFTAAQAAWPENEQTKALIRATEARRTTLRTIADGQADATDGPVAAPIPETALAPLRPSSERGQEPRTAAEGAASDGPPRGGAELNEEVGLRLARIEAKLVVGDLDAIVSDLLAMQRAHPEDPRVGIRLARLLLQRGLMRYGQGLVGSAIADWQRAIELDPSMRSARVLLELAAPELAAGPR